MSAHEFRQIGDKRFGEFICLRFEAPADLTPQIDQDGLSFVCDTCDDSLTLAELTNLANVFNLTPPDTKG